MTIKAVKILSKILASNFQPHDIEHLAREVLRDFNLHEISGYPDHYHFFAKEAAEVTARFFFDANRFKEFADYVMSLHGNTYKGREVKLNNLQELKNAFSQVGLEYNEKKKRVLFTQKFGLRSDFGDCKDGQEYNFSLMKIGIAKPDNLERKYDDKHIYNSFKIIFDYMREHIENRDGRIWSWLGDNGLCAFYGKDKAVSAVYSALQIIIGVHLFNAEKNILGNDFGFRIGLHTGPCIYRTNTEKILSSAINFVAHLEAQHTKCNSITASETVVQNLDNGLRKLFVPDGMFEGNMVFSLKYKIGI